MQWVECQCGVVNFDEVSGGMIMEDHIGVNFIFLLSVGYSIAQLSVEEEMSIHRKPPTLRNGNLFCFNSYKESLPSVVDKSHDLNHLNGKLRHLSCLFPPY